MTIPGMMNMQSMMASALSSRLKLFLISGDERTLQVKNIELNIGIHTG